MSPHEFDEGVGKVIAGTAVEPHPLAALAGNDAKAVMLDLMQPLAAGLSLSVLVGRHGAMNPAGRARIRNIMRIFRDHSRPSQSF